MLAWGNWNHANRQSRINNEQNKCVEEACDEEGKMKRKELVNGSWSEKNKQKRRRKQYKHKYKKIGKQINDIFKVIKTLLFVK